MKNWQGAGPVLSAKDGAKSGGTPSFAKHSRFAKPSPRGVSAGARVAGRWGAWIRGGSVRAGFSAVRSPEARAQHRQRAAQPDEAAPGVPHPGLDRGAPRHRRAGRARPRRLGLGHARPRG